MLEQVLEMTSFNCQTWLTPGEQVIKYSLKFLFGYYRYCEPGDFFKFILCVRACVKCSPICCLPDFPQILVTNSQIMSDIPKEQATNDK